MTKTILCALLICTSGVPFHNCAADETTAAHSGFQFGLGVGGGQLHVSEPDTGASIEMGAFAYTAFAGYRINRYMAVEASYLDGGPMRKENSESLFATEPHIATATGMGILPIGQTFSLFARAGLAHWCSMILISRVALVSSQGRTRRLSRFRSFSLWQGWQHLSLEFVSSVADHSFSSP